MNKVYGFEGEAKDKYGDMTYKLFADVFTARTSLFRTLFFWLSRSQSPLSLPLSYPVLSETFLTTKHPCDICLIPQVLPSEMVLRYSPTSSPHVLWLESLQPKIRGFGTRDTR